MRRVHGGGRRVGACAGRGRVVDDHPLGSLDAVTGALRAVGVRCGGPPERECPAMGASDGRLALRPRLSQRLDLDDEGFDLTAGGDQGGVGMVRAHHGADGRGARRGCQGV